MQIHIGRYVFLVKYDIGHGIGHRFGFLEIYDQKPIIVSIRSRIYFLPSISWVSWDFLGALNSFFERADGIRRINDRRTCSIIRSVP